MKKINIKLIISSILLFLIIGCNKDKKIIVDEGKDDNRDIRVNQVDFISAYHSETKSYQYKYDNNGVLSELDLLRNDTLDDKSIEILYNNNNINFRYLDGVADLLWQNIYVFISGNKVERINVTTPLNLPQPFSTEGELSIIRDKNNKFEKVGFNNFYSNNITTYFPFESKITKFNSYGLPELSESKPSFIRSNVTNYKVLFSFEYVRATEIPSKLKRLVNEELLFINRYGISNNDAGYLLKENTSLLYGNYYGNQYGEGNWLISFGLPQYYILEDKSSYIVTSRTAKIYKINADGSEEFIKSKTDNFPYIHDATAKTLEIGGLKISYEFDDEN